MTHSPGILLTLVAFMLVLGPLVFVHELGHYLVGRWFGVKADEFSIGFGPEIAGWTDKRGTRWRLSALPLGGYVRFAGDMNPASQPSADWLALPAEERRRTFQAKPLWQRALVVAAGPVTNFLLAILILAGFAMIYGVDRTPAVVKSVEPHSAAQRAGVNPGDRVVSVAGRGIATFGDLYDFTVLRPGEHVELTVDRGGNRVTLPITIGVVDQTDRFGNHFRIGRMGIAPIGVVYERASVFEAPVAGLRGVVSIVRATLDGLGQIITGRRSADELGGPIKIARAAGERLTLGWPQLIDLMALVSINLGFINLLPVPVLDGGHLLFYAIEGVRRRPIEPQVQEWAFRGGLAAILALMLFVTFNDLASYGVWKNLTGLIG